jgi:hypothetical protein
MKKASWIVLALALLAVGARPASAQFRIGPNLTFADDFDLGIGAIALFGIGNITSSSAITGTAGAEYYVSPCDNCTYFEITAGALYGFNTSGSARPSVGGALNFGRFSYDAPTQIPGVDFDFTNSEIGLAILGQLGFPLGTLSGLANARLTISGYEQLVLGFAILFGGGG